tara:strand:- start:707 stop:961 length:255 start_codon:yes stop_codon:yes gene_type:complete
MENKKNIDRSKLNHLFDYHFSDPARGANVELDVLEKAFKDRGYDLHFGGGASQYIVSSECPEELGREIFEGLIADANAEVDEVA